MGKQGRRTACTGYATLGIDHDIARIDEPCFQQRRQRKDGGRRIAAGVRHQRGRTDLLAEQLGQAVGHFAQPVRIRVLLVIPFGKDLGTVQSVVRTEVDDPSAGVQKLRGDRSTDAMRQAAEDAFGPSGHFGGRQLL